MDSIIHAVRTHYAIDIRELEQQKGGWASLAYKVNDGKTDYFLKVYEKHRASTPKLTAKMNHYVPVLLWLKENSSLNEKISVPILTNYQAYTCEDEMNIYMLFDYIEGDTIGDQTLTSHQVKQFAQIISELHAFGEDIPFDTDAIKEDFDVPFLEPLRHTLSSEHHVPSDVWQLLRTTVAPIKEKIIKVERLVQHLQSADLRMALCHTDLHFWNLMQSQHVILIDWEGMKLAPVEADMIFLVNKPFFNDFLEMYRQKHPNYSIHPEALQFYQEKRKLEDIWEFIEQLMYDEQEEREREVTMNYLKEELKLIRE